MGLRNDLQAWHNGDSLVAQVARNNNNTIVVVNSVGPLILEKWINHPNGELDRFFLCLSELSITAFATSFSDCGSTYNLDSRPVTNFVIDTSPSLVRPCWSGSRCVKIQVTENYLFIPYRQATL